VTKGACDTRKTHRTKAQNKDQKRSLKEYRFISFGRSAAKVGRPIFFSTNHAQISHFFIAFGKNIHSAFL
jgi:hypothetical protein